jgi:hypothetical protein
MMVAVAVTSVLLCFRQWYLLLTDECCLADRCHVDLAVAMLAKIALNEKKYPAHLVSPVKSWCLAMSVQMHELRPWCSL